MKKYLIINLVLLFSIGLGNCTYNPQSKREHERYNKLELLSELVQSKIKADCVYCTNTQAFQGNCTCYQDIPLGTCMGIPSGTGKSNSYNITCSTLTTNGIWANVSPNAFTCTYQTCPPAAYQAAFSAQGQ
ncbi:hypothetical protein [Leptospira inadai]|nr:hypothetical protein [Leptospira inadai]PNV74451.1 hypothetical protein BES34_013930 [Leptospira inadai serovar Lyme]